MVNDLICVNINKIQHLFQRDFPKSFAVTFPKQEMISENNELANTSLTGCGDYFVGSKVRRRAEALTISSRSNNMGLNSPLTNMLAWSL